MKTDVDETDGAVGSHCAAFRFCPRHPCGGRRGLFHRDKRHASQTGRPDDAFSRNGKYYMPYIVFNDFSLGVYYTYNKEKVYPDLL